MEKIKSNLNISTNDLKEYAKELYNQILNDEFYHVLVEEGWNQEEIFNNVTKFKEYLDDMHKAQNIKTFEDCLKYNMTQRLILVRNGKFIDRDYITLLPFKEYTEYLERFVARDFGSLPTDANLDKCMKKLKNGILGEFKKNKWVYLYGVQRSGRSYAALAFLNYIYKKRKDKKPTFAFIDTIYRFKFLNDLYFKDRTYFNELINSYSEVDFLVLDNFGSEFKNEIIRDTILYPIIKTRLTNSKTTIFTSDFLLDEVKALYTFSKRNRPDYINDQLFEALNKTVSQLEVSNIPLY